MRWILTTLFAMVLLLALSVYFYCPCERVPGGYLLGDVVETRVSDWSFANDVRLCQIEVRAVLPHSVNLNCMASDGVLYLSCASCAGKRWSEAAMARPAARIRIGEKIYPVNLTKVTDAAELDVAWRARAAKVGAPADAPRADGWWSFRVTSRATG